jgi:transcriptional regulator with XRE-family HTH domain
MRINSETPFQVMLEEIGSRIAGARLERNLTQAELAAEAGVSKRTIERMESGEVATRLEGFLRVCRVLGLIDRVDQMIPEAVPSPMALLKLSGKRRQRASGRRVSEPKPVKWSWGE